MSERARHAETGRFVCASQSKAEPKWTLCEDAQQALAVHVFTGPMPVTRASIFTGNTTTQHATMRVCVHVQLASRVCKTWKRAFAEWVPRGIAGASARAWAWAIREGLDRCQYSAYVQHTVPGVPYLPVDSFLPRQTKVEWWLFLHSKALGTLTLTRRLEDVVGDGEVVDGEEHMLNVVYAPARAPRFELATMHNALRVGSASLIIPHACWTEDNGWRNDLGESAVEEWQRMKAAFLERWVLQKHGVFTRDWRVNTQDRSYYWG